MSCQAYGRRFPVKMWFRIPLADRGPYMNPRSKLLKGGYTGDYIGECYMGS